jgi:hypothetical protein
LHHTSVIEITNKGGHGLEGLSFRNRVYGAKLGVNGQPLAKNFLLPSPHVRYWLEIAFVSLKDAGVSFLVF